MTDGNCCGVVWPAVLGLLLAGCAGPGEPGPSLQERSEQDRARRAGEVRRLLTGRPPAKRARILEALKNLGSPHFFVHTQAARYLVECGNQIIAVVVAHGGTRTSQGVRTPVAPGVIRAVMRSQKSDQVLAHLDSPHRVVVIQAVKELGGRKPEEVRLQRLVDLLDHDDEGLSESAYEALRELTGLPDKEPADWRAERVKLARVYRDFIRARRRTGTARG